MQSRRSAHDAPRDSLLRHDVGETVRPRAPELGHAIIVEVKELGAGRAGLVGGWVPPELGRALLLEPTPRPWPSSVLLGSGA